MHYRPVKETYFWCLLLDDYFQSFIIKKSTFRKYFPPSNKEIKSFHMSW